MTEKILDPDGLKIYTEQIHIKMGSQGNANAALKPDSYQPGNLLLYDPATGKLLDAGVTFLELLTYH